MAALIYDPSLLEDPELVVSVGAAARLALENSRLQAELRAQLLIVRDSRARIVVAADAERRRIERNLHDGAQQRLLGVRLALRLAAQRPGDEPKPARRERRRARGPLDELRALARGLHPPVLTDRAWPRRSRRSRDARAPGRASPPMPDDRLPAAVESAAYFVASEALANVVKHAQRLAGADRVARADGRVVVEVADDGVGGADADGTGLRGLRDRVEALDGMLPSTARRARHVGARRAAMRVILADDACVSARASPAC